MPSPDVGFKPLIMLATVSLATAAAALIGAVFMAVAVGRFERLDRGEDRLARWRIDPATWAGFAAANRLRQEEMEPRWKTNLVTIAETTASPVEITVSREAVRIGEDYYELDKGTMQGIRWLQGAPAMLEFFFMIPKPGGTNFYYTVRFPVEADAEQAARDVFAFFSAPLPQGPVSRALQAPGIAARLNPRKARGIALIVAALGAAAGLTAIAYLSAQPEIPRAWEHEDPAGDLAVAAIGASLAVTIPALLVALVSHLRLRSSG